MDWLQGPMINPSCQFLDHQCLEEEEEEQQQHTRFEEELDETMPFLHMLQSFETPSFFPFKEPSFQALLRLQHLKKKNHNNNTWEFETTNIYNNNNYLSHEIMETQIQALEFEPFGNNDTANTYHDSPVKSELLKAHHNNHLEQEEEQELETQNAKTGLGLKDKRKRKRTRPIKNKEEVESQRMTHITVERNRRRQMNEHLTVLRSLMPKTYIQRGDQASIVGGAIDFVKELEQLAQSLEGQKRMRISTLEFESTTNSSLSSSSSSSNSSSTLSSCSSLSNNNNNNNGLLLRSERKTELADIEATVIQTHVNLKIQCPKRPSQLLKAIVALEELRLAILHLNINTSSHDTVLYSFNLKIEDGCNLRSADEICGAVHQIFRNIDGR